MKRVATGIALGLAAGVIGIIVYELTDQQIAGWLITGVLLGVAAQFPLRAKGRWALGGGIIFASWLVGRVVQYPILIAWPLLGAVFGCLAPPNGLGRRISGGTIGLMAGLLGMGILPLITLALLPALGLPTSFDFDMDVLGLVFDMDMLGLVVAGVFIGGTTAWLQGDEGKIAKKSKRRITARGKKR
jgi:hypothetical protein